MILQDLSTTDKFSMTAEKQISGSTVRIPNWARGMLVIRLNGGPHDGTEITAADPLPPLIYCSTIPGNKAISSVLSRGEPVACYRRRDQNTYDFTHFNDGYNVRPGDKSPK